MQSGLHASRAPAGVTPVRTAIERVPFSCAAITSCVASPIIGAGRVISDTICQNIRRLKNDLCLIDQQIEEFLMLWQQMHAGIPSNPRAI